MNIHIITPHGFCSGVARAIRIAEETLLRYPNTPLYCLHEIVHNQHVVNRLTLAGMTFVQTLAEVPMGACVLFSAHGVAPTVRVEAHQRQLLVVDATCPFVDKVHREVLQFAQAKTPVVCIGHKGHDEVVGVVGEAPDYAYVVESEADIVALPIPRGSPLAVVSQTTISATMYDSLMVTLLQRYPNLQVPRKTDICYATRDRQTAVTEAAPYADHMLILGSSNSSNSKRLVETARVAGCHATLIGTCADLDDLDLSTCQRLAITSGASTPERFLDEVLDVIQHRYPNSRISP